MIEGGHTMKQVTFPIKSIIQSVTFFALVLIGLPRVSNATSFIFSDFNGTLRTSTGTQVTTINEMMFGFFTGGFTPTTNNFAQWLPNFRGVSGYADTASPEWSAAIDISDNTSYPINTQLHVIVYNILESNEANKASATQAAIFTNPRWTIISASATDLVPNYFDFSGSFQGYDNSSAEINRLTGSVSMVVGGLSGSTISMAVIPEPSTMSLALMGISIFAAFRRKILSNRQRPK